MKKFIFLLVLIPTLIFAQADIGMIVKELGTLPMGPQPMSCHEEVACDYTGGSSSKNMQQLLRNACKQALDDGKSASEIDAFLANDLPRANNTESCNTMAVFKESSLYKNFGKFLATKREVTYSECSTAEKIDSNTNEDKFFKAQFWGNGDKIQTGFYDKVLSDSKISNDIEQIKKFYPPSMVAKFNSPTSDAKLSFIASHHHASSEFEGRFGPLILRNLKESSPKSLIIERTDRDIDCGFAVPKLFDSEATATSSAEYREHDIAAWYALNNALPFRGSEPLEYEVLNLFEKNKESFSNREDYLNYKIFDCLSSGARSDSEKKMKGQLIEASKTTFEYYFTNCSQQVPGRMHEEVSKSKDQTLIAAVDSFYSKLTYEDYIKWCEKKNAFDPDLGHQPKGKVAFSEYLNNPGLIRTGPKEPVEKGSITSISQALGYIKNYCVRNSIAENMKKGDTTIIYGQGHLLENYDIFMGNKWKLESLELNGCEDFKGICPTVKKLEK